MTDIGPLLPRSPVPDGAAFDPAAEEPRHFTLVVAYRGLPCPIRRTRLRDSESRPETFAERGVGVVARSTDDEARASRAKRERRLSLAAGHGIASVGIEEPSLFAEPGLLLVRPDRALCFSSVRTMPFAGPSFADILAAIDDVIGGDYPARGEVATLECGRAAF